VSKVILYTAVSEDYFIAKPDGGIDWLHNPAYGIEGEDFGYSDLYESIQVTLMGRKTFEQVDGFDMPFPYVGKQNFVFTRNLPQETHEHVEFVREVIPLVQNLKKEKDQDIWLIGGGEMNTLLMKAGLVDEIRLTIIPVKLTEGIALCEPLDLLGQYEAIRQRSFDNGFVQVDLKYSS